MTGQGALVVAMRGALLGAAVAAVLGPVSRTDAAAYVASLDAPDPGFEVSFLPPGLLLRGEDVTFSVVVDSSTSAAFDASGDLFVKGDRQAVFTRVHLSSTSNLTARVPAAALDGSVVLSYVVVADALSETSVTVPPAGSVAPYRSWILDDPPTVRLGAHAFGMLRVPDGIVVDAPVGTENGAVGIECPDEGPCDAPQSFDIGPDGTVWVADIHNGRLEAWPAGASGTARTIPLEYGPADLAVAPDGTIYVWGVSPGVGMRMHALEPDGHERWVERMPSDIFNEHVRMGPDGVAYLRTSLFGWVPATDAHGDPLDVEAQRALAVRDQPLAEGFGLVVSTGCHIDPSCENPLDARVGLGTTAGSLATVWHITSDTVIVDEPDAAVPAVAGGDPVLISSLYDFEKHLQEYEVLRLGPDGSIIDRFSLGRGAEGGDLPVTDVRIGPDGDVYQMQYDAVHPDAGMQIARYELAESTASGSPTASASPTPLPTQSGTPAPTHAPTPPPAPSGAGWSPVVWTTVSLAAVALVGGITAAVWLRRRARPR